MSLNKQCIALIHVAKNQLGLSDEEYQTIISEIGGVQSSKELDYKGFEAVMSQFNRMGFKSTSKKPRPFGERAGMATNAQVALIRKLWDEYTENEGTDSSLGKWIERTFKVSSLRFLTSKQAPKAITGLKNMKKRKSSQK